jgi:hydroxyacyl-ACP dehydratase HTD2-like protein with hotdog domain
MTVLNEDVLSHVGRKAEPRVEVVTRRDIRKYSIATRQTQDRYLQGDVAPPLYHLALFWDVVPLEDLSPDGVSVDRLLPKFPLERAMAGGLDVEYHRRIYPGDTLVGNRTLTNIYEKQGSSGPLIFYEVVLEVTLESGEPVTTEKTTRILR